jgi:hypothetical protein
LTGNQPASFFIKSVTLPNGWTSAYLAPGLEERFSLLPDQKDFTGILVAKMATDLAEGERAVVEVTWGAEAPAVHGYEQTIRDLVVKDTTPPIVALRTQTVPQGTVATIGVRDVGGIHHPPRLIVSRKGGSDTTATTEVFIVPLRSSL